MVSLIQKYIYMSLFSSKKNKKAPQEVPENSFLCITFTEKGVRAAFWNIGTGEIQTKNTSALYSFETEEDGVIATDDALKELGSASEAVGEVVFGFDPKWVDDDGLVKEKKPFIKKLAESLSLKPVGFVVLTDALVQDILSRDKMISQIIVYVQETALSLILLKKGKVTQQLSVGRSAEVVSDIVEGLARLKEEKNNENSFLPAKMVLASLVLPDQEIQEIRTQIIGYDWADKHPFVQAPLIEQFTGNQVLNSVIEQGGMAVADTRSIVLKSDDENQETGKNETDAKTDSNDFGFESVDPDLAGDNFASVETDAKKQAATSFGIPIVAQDLPEDRPERKSSHMDLSSKEKSEKKSPFSAKKKNRFKGKLAAWYKNHPHKNMILGGVIGGIVASIGLFIGWLTFSYKVEISLQLAEKVISKDVEILVDPTVATSNVEKLILRGELETEEFSGTKVVDTTGVKLAGEKAKGKITIFNKTTSPKTFAAGTILSAGSFNFSLDEEITVASASVTESGTSETKDYGKLETQVTATKIGADGNIAKESSLSIGSFDTGTYSASSIETFSGGSSREIRVISEDDKEEVLSSLKKELSTKAQDDFSSKSGDGLYYVLTGNQAVEEADYGGKVGEEADELALELVMSFEAVRYSSEDIQPLVLELLKEEIPEGYELTDKDPEILSSPKEEATKSAQVVLSANISAKALPIFDMENIISVLKGLPLEAVAGKISERPEIRGASYQVKPSLAKTFVSTVPEDKERIIITIKEDTAQ